MPNATRIVQRRVRRRQQDHRGGRRPWRVLTLLLGGLLACGLLSFLAASVGGTAAYAYFSRDLPDLASLEQEAQAPYNGSPTQIYGLGDDADGDGRRDWVLIYEIQGPLAGPEVVWRPLSSLPAAVASTAIASMEPNFYQATPPTLLDFGRDLYAQLGNPETAAPPTRLATAVVRRALSHTPPANSPTTQHLRERLLAQRLEQEYSRDAILEWYVNSAFYGNLAFGIEAAAQVYFNKPASQLSLPEAAMLAGIAADPDPNHINPLDDPTAAKARQERVLEALWATGQIDRESLVAAQFTPLVFANGLEARYDIIAPHYAKLVRHELEAQWGAERVLYGGLQVYTALDLRLQSQAECVARAHVARLSGALGTGLPADEASRCPALALLPPLELAAQGQDWQVNNAAVVAIDPRTGELRALVGGLQDWSEAPLSELDMATAATHQPGTALAPFSYLTALAQGYTAATMMLDVETDFGTAYDGIAYVPQNPNGRFHGPLSLRQGLSSGLPVPAVEVLSWVGVESSVRTAEKMGITTLSETTNQYGLTLALGGGKVTVLEMVYAYAVLANKGRMVGQSAPPTAEPSAPRPLDPVAIVRIETNTGELLYAYDQPQQQDVLTPQLAYLLNDILADAKARCVAGACPVGLDLPDGRPTAVQVGSTNDFRDAWTIGYTPQLVVGVWVGNSNNRPTRQLTGELGAAPIWHALLGWAMQDEPLLRWERPPGLTERTVCTPSGLLSNGLCPTVDELFLTGTEPTVYDTLYQEVLVNRETGRLATIYTPTELVEQRLYLIYPASAATWAAEQGVERPPTEYDTVPLAAGNTAASPQIAILTPAPFGMVRGQVAVVGAAETADLAHYRVAYFEGLAPTTLHVITDNVTLPPPDGVLAVWDTTPLNGLYTVVLTVVRQDGTFAEVNVPVTVDNVPPTAVLTATQPVAGGTEVLLAVEAADEVQVARVAFYADGAGVPFATRTAAPFTAVVAQPPQGCTTFRAVAFDGAGNRGESAAVDVCGQE